VICQHLRGGPFVHRRGLAGSALHRFRPTRTIRHRLRILHSVTTVREASASQPVRGSVRSSRWERLSHGPYVPREPRRLTVDLAAWQLVLPASGCFHFSHFGTAAWLVATSSIASAPLRRGPRSQPAYFVLARRRKACPLAPPQHGGARSGITWSRSNAGPGVGPADPCQTCRRHPNAGVVFHCSGLRFRCSTSGASPLGSQSCVCCTSSRASTLSRRRRSTTSGATLWRGLTYGWLVLVGSMSTTAKNTVSGMSTGQTSRESPVWLRPTCSASDSPRPSCSTREHRSSRA
jgi:hypothetical protein